MSVETEVAVNEPEEVLTFWFGTLDRDGRADPAHAERWFRSDPAFDASIRERFDALHAAVGRGEREDWLAAPRGRLSYVIVLDQFSRNLYRGTGRMFAWDAQALAVALAGADAGEDQALAFDERSFLYMPLMHSESLAVQDRCVALFTSLRDGQSGRLREHAAYSLDFAERHRDIVQRFGRFPHRNALLGRASTPEELEFLAQAGSSF